MPGTRVLAAGDAEDLGPLRTSRKHVQVDQGDLQGNVLAGYGFDRAVFVFMRLRNPPAGRALLHELIPLVTTAVPFGDDKPPATLNIAFTFDGLRALGVPEKLLDSFPTDFKEGMAARADGLGDVGPNAPDGWEQGLRAGDPHVLVTINAQDRETLDSRMDLVRRLTGEGPEIDIVHEQRTTVIERLDPGPVEAARGPLRRKAKRAGKALVLEHFGFVDGLAQPSIGGQASSGGKVGPHARDGQGTPTSRGWKDLAPGEFVLGYEDEAKQVAATPADPLMKNGTYMVVRKLQQDVALFYNYMLYMAGGDRERAEFLSAKAVGRWRDGTPVELSPTERPESDEAREPPNDFRYGNDPDGFRCPVGSHIRRANPRDALGFQGKLTARHRIIRRGMPYGERAKDPYIEDGIDRGLMFVCYQASIERQFELIQGRWLADGDAFNLGTHQDFLLGTDDPRGKLTIEGKPPHFLGPQRTFVTLRGGGYFFTPGISALGALTKASR